MTYNKLVLIDENNQHPTDEHTLWEHLQNRDFDSAIDTIDWYYEKSNPEGFDDPDGITKATLIKSGNKELNDLSIEYKIRKRRMSYGAPLIATAVFALFFVFLSFKTNSWGPMLILSPLVPFAIYAIIVMIFDRAPVITINPYQLEFKKSTKLPIPWSNVLQIYHYHRKPIRAAGAYFAADFIEIYMKDAVKPESYYIKDLELKPTDIVYLIEKYKSKYSR